MKTLRLLVITGFLLTSMALPLLAQTSTGTILGIVRDSSGAVVPGTTVRAVEISTSVERSTESSGLGYFVILFLPPGTYRIEAEKTGFQKSVQTNVKLEIAMKLEIDVTLQTGSVRQTVTVTGQSPLLETTSSSTGQEISRQEVASLPSSNRNLMQIATALPGVVVFGATAAPATSGSVGFGNWVATGGVSNTNEFMLDGATAIMANMNGISIIPTLDALQEFKIQTNGLPAEYGRTGGAVLNAIYKSGSNAPHGMLYDYAKNRVLNASTWANNKAHLKTTFTNVQTFGGTFGGPVELPKVYDGRDRTFFFFNFEGYRDVLPASILTTVPTAAQLQGNFSQTFNASGSQTVIYDPTTAALVAGSTTQYARQPFTGNIIQTNRINTVAANIIKYYAAPNFAPSNTYTNANNYLVSPSGKDRQNEWTLKIDHNLGTTRRLFARYAQSSQGGGAANVFGATPACNTCLAHTNPAGSYSPRGGGSDLFVWPKNFVAGYTHTLSPSLLLDLRLAVNRQFLARIPQSTGFDLTSLGMPPSLAQYEFWDQFPVINIQNYLGLGTYSNGDLIRRGDATLATEDSLTKIAGRHTLKMGADFRQMRYDEVQVSDESTNFSFDTTWTQQNPYTATTNSGYGLASFLLGIPTGGDIIKPNADSIQLYYIAGYIQDDWRVTNRLTLNLGFRYDVETPYTERYNRMSYFDPTAKSAATNYVSTALGGLAFPGVNGNSRYRQNLAVWRPGPRLGLAYKMPGSMVLRAAYGILYQPSLDINGYGASPFGDAPWLATTSFVSSTNGGLSPSGSLSNPFPSGFLAAPGSSLGASALLGTGISDQLKNLPVTYIQQYNAGFQKQIRSWMVDVGYVGSHGVHVAMQVPMDQLLPSQYALGSALNTQVANPFLGMVSIGSYANATLSRGQLLEPFPQFAGITNQDENIGFFEYNSLQVKAERRFANGFGILASYVWSKEIGNAASLYYNTSDTVQNEYDLRAERTLNPYNIPRRLTVDWLWELPLGKGYRFLNNVPSSVNRVVTGWQVNGIMVLQDGLPLVIANSSNVVGFGAGSRPNNNGQSARLPSSQRTPSRWFNTSVFSLPPAYTFGTQGPTSSDLRGQGQNGWNVSLAKRTPIREGVNLEFRAEFYNFFNHPLWSSPGSTVNTTTFGVVSSKSGNRTGQLALKLIF
jgi:hypothetical protein